MEDLRTPEIGGLAGMRDKLKAMFGEQGPTAPTPAAPEGQAAAEAAEPPVQEVIPAAPAPGPLAALPVAEELPEWLRPPQAVITPDLPVTPVPERGKGAEGVPEAWRDEFAHYADKSSNNEYLEGQIKWAEEQMGKGIKILTSGMSDDKSSRMPIEEYIGRLREIIASREVQAAPAAIAFPARVEAARRAAIKAMKETGELPDKIAAEMDVAADMRQGLSGETGMRTPELSDAELETLEEADRVLAGHDEDLGMRVTGTRLKRNVLDLQRQYKLGRELAAEADRRYGQQLAQAAKELKPGWRRKEPALMREMSELQALFNRFGEEAGLRKQISDLEEAKTNTLWLILNRKQKEAVEFELSRARSGLAALTSVDGFMAREDMPGVLREVIEATRTGKQFDFGTGPVADFRRGVYELIVGALGIEAAPTVEVSEAVVSAAVPTPEPEPEPEPAAAVETEAEKRKTAEREFFGDTRIPEADEMSGGQKQMVEGIRDRKRRAVQAALGLAQRAEANPDQREDILAVAKQTVGMVLRAAEAEKDPKKRRELIGWTKEFVGALEGTSLAGGLSGRALDALIGLIVAQLSGK